MSRISTLAVLTILAVATSACGDRPVDRALTGGAIGAGGGALVGSAVGNPVAGAGVWAVPRSVRPPRPATTDNEQAETTQRSRRADVPSAFLRLS